MGHEGKLAILAAANSQSGDSSLPDFQAEMYTAHNLVSYFFAGTDTLVVSGMQNTISEAGELICRTLSSHESALTYRETPFLDTRIIDVENWANYLSFFILKFLTTETQGLIVVTTGVNTKDLRSMNVLNGRGPIMNLAPTCAWVQEGRGTMPYTVSASGIELTK